MALNDWKPAIADVGARLRARTKDDMGHELGTFTAETRPTAAEVAELIDEAQQEVASVVGELTGDAECVNRLWPRAKTRVALYTAMLIELGYYPEQVETGRSPYPALERLYDRSIKVLKDAAQDCLGGEGEAVGDDGGGQQMPSYFFDEQPVVGRRTVW